MFNPKKCGVLVVGKKKKKEKKWRLGKVRINKVNEYKY